MKSAVSAIIFAVLLLASPLFVAAGSTRQEVGAKVVAHLAKRQGSLPSCTTQACMTYAQTMLACIGNGATTDYLKAVSCSLDRLPISRVLTTDHITTYHMPSSFLSFVQAKCMCDNKAVALSCYQTCNQDQNSLTEAQINEACAQIISNSATIESVISQFASSTRSAAATT